MAKLAAPLIDDQPESAVVVSSADPPELSDGEILRLVARMIRRRNPEAIDPCLVWRVPGNTQQGCIPLPTVAHDLSELASDILEVLVDAEGWLNGSEIGRRLNPADPVNHTAGTFRRAIDQLEGAGLIEKPNQRKGYRAKR